MHVFLPFLTHVPPLLKKKNLTSPQKNPKTSALKNDEIKLTTKSLPLSLPLIKVATPECPVLTNHLLQPAHLI